MSEAKFGANFVNPTGTARKVVVKRDILHPITRNPGFDLMEIKTSSAEDLGKAIEEAESKFWKVWVSGYKESVSLGGALMYKPCDIREPWIDTLEQPHPGCKRDDGSIDF